MGAPVRLRARVVESSDDRATVEGTLESGGTVTATCRGTFVIAKKGHPAHPSSAPAPPPEAGPGR